MSNLLLQLIQTLNQQISRDVMGIPLHKVDRMRSRGLLPCPQIVCRALQEQIKYNYHDVRNKKCDDNF